MATSASSAPAPERWSIDAHAREIARLDIPADAQRERRFEISCAFIVASGGGADAWHALKLQVDGALEWERREPTHPGGRDSLDVRLRKTVPVGRPLRLLATTEVHRAARVSLVMTAEEA